MSYSYLDVVAIPSNRGVANLTAITCGAPKGASNQYANVQHVDTTAYGYFAQPTGITLYNKLAKHFPFSGDTIISTSGMLPKG